MAFEKESFLVIENLSPSLESFVEQAQVSKFFERFANAHFNYLSVVVSSWRLPEWTKTIF